MGERTLLAEDERLYEACRSLVELAVREGVSIGCAESCTGGLVSGCLTAVPGSSAVVRGGVVSYALSVKRSVLGVPPEVLYDPEMGAVSPECATQMARGAREVLDSDVAVSVTGIAGPGGEEPGKPVGTVWFGLATAGGARASLAHFDGDRAEVRRLAVAQAVRLLREGVMEVVEARS